MPYIKQDRRKDYDDAVNSLLTSLRKSGDVGDLNYVITRLVAGTCSPSFTWSYEELNKAIGVVECVKHELYHRIGQPKEACSAERNGDVREYHIWSWNIQ